MKPDTEITNQHSVGLKSLCKITSCRFFFFAPGAKYSGGRGSGPEGGFWLVSCGERIAPSCAHVTLTPCSVLGRTSALESKNSALRRLVVKAASWSCRERKRDQWLLSRHATVRADWAKPAQGRSERVRRSRVVLRVARCPSLRVAFRAQSMKACSPTEPSSTQFWF